MDNNSVKENIIRLRKKLNLSQTEIAERMGISRTAYRNIEKGDTRLISENILKIADILEVHSEELVLGYCPDRDKDGSIMDGDAYRKMQDGLRAKYESDAAKMKDEISRLHKEIKSLNEYIEAQRELINTKDEIISMLKRLDSDKGNC